MATTLTAYSSTNDGQVTSGTNNYLTARTGSGLSASVNSSSAQSAAQQKSGSTYYLSEMFFDFTVASRPDNAVSAAYISLYMAADYSTVDYDQQIYLCDYGTSLTTADWVAGENVSGYTLIASLNTSGIGGAGYKQFDLNEAGLTAVTALLAGGGGHLRVMTCSDRFVAGTAPTGTEFLTFHTTGYTGTSRDPLLSYTYDVVSGGTTYAATYATASSTGYAAAATVRRAATSSAGAVATGYAAAATIKHGHAYAATHASNVVTGAAFAANAKYPASLADNVVTGYSAAATVKHGHGYAATFADNVVTGYSAAATVKRPATSSAGAVVTGFSAAATSKHPTTKTDNVVTGYSASATIAHGHGYAATHASATTTGYTATATTKRAATSSAGAVVTGYSAAATVTEAPTDTTATFDVVTGCTANVTAKFGTAHTTSAVTGTTFTALVKHYCTSTNTATTGATASPTAKHYATRSDAVTTGSSGTATAKYVVGGQFDAVTDYSADATVTPFGALDGLVRFDIVTTVSMTAGYIDVIAGTRHKPGRGADRKHGGGNRPHAASGSRTSSGPSRGHGNGSMRGH